MNAIVSLPLRSGAMEEFAAAIIQGYIGGVSSREEIRNELRIAGGIVVRDQSTAGAYIELPKCAVLKLDRPSKKRVWTGLVARVNSSHLVNILLFINEGQIDLIELTAPLDDFPDQVDSFKFIETPADRP
jgi:hypothetical protein